MMTKPAVQGKRIAIKPFAIKPFAGVIERAESPSSEAITIWRSRYGDHRSVEVIGA
jgi:hypothetical protein